MATQLFADEEYERGDCLDDRVFRLAVEQMRRQSRHIDDDVLAHINPAHSENINFFGAIEVDIDAEVAALGPTGYRPLRVRDTLF